MKKGITSVITSVIIALLIYVITAFINNSTNLMELDKPIRGLMSFFWLFGSLAATLGVYDKK